MLTSRACNKVKKVTWSISRYQASISNSSIMFSSEMKAKSKILLPLIVWCTWWCRKFSLMQSKKFVPCPQALLRGLVYMPEIEIINIIFLSLTFSIILNILCLPQHNLLDFDNSLLSRFHRPQKIFTPNRFYFVLFKYFPTHRFDVISYV